VPEQNTYAFLGAMPNPVGVNQPVLLHVGITDYLSSYDMGWEGLTVSVVDPEGIESSIGPIRTDSTGGTGRMFTPTKVGTYTLQTHFPTQTVPVQAFFSPVAHDVTYLASVSDPVELVVQEEAIPYYPGHSLPSEYWTRPIDAQLREWNVIAGSWLETNRRAPRVVTGNDDAPETAHILWTTPLAIGGVAGVETGEHQFDCGDAYAGKWDNRLIVAGILMYRTDPVVTPTQTIAVDLRTGEELWRHDFTFSFGQVYHHNSINRHASYAYVWREVSEADRSYTLMAYDPLTGQWAYNITNRPSGTRTFGPIGELLYYSISGGQMTMWNSSWAYMEGMTSMSQAWNVLHTSINATERGHQWTIDVPTGLPGSVSAVKLGDRVFGARLTSEAVYTWAFSLAPGHEGALLFNKTWNAPAAWAAGNLTLEANAVSIDDGAYTMWTKQNRQYYGFSTETGDYLWGPTPSEAYQNQYGWTAFGERPTLIYDGKLYSTGVSGIVYCYDVLNGTVLWTYEATDPYQEYLFANSWWLFLQYITDGKVYLGSLEHSAIDPKPRGAPFVCLDATTGDVVWRANGLFRQTLWGGISIIGDSVIATMDTYDQRIYAVGKGPSTITAESPLMGVPKGTSVTIQGTVTDVSPGTKSERLLLRFPNGVPVVSDESMSDWMLYVYKQFEKPDTTGVEVTLEAIDPNGNYEYLGTATSDASGKYGFTFEPEMEGKYMILATFYGSAGYYGSTTTTYVTVDPAPEDYPVPPTADEIAGETISRLPAYPDVPSATAVAQETVSQMPAYPEMPEIPDIPAYLTIDLAIIVAVVIAIIIGLYGILKKQK
jgi:outer membrane protein assembly factor BamB